MKNKKWIWIILLIIVIFVVAAFLFYRFSNFKSNNNYSANKTSAEGQDNSKNSSNDNNSTKSPNETNNIGNAENSSNNQNSTISNNVSNSNQNPTTSTTNSPNSSTSPNNNSVNTNTAELISTFSTKIYTKNSERQNNVTITCNTLNDTIVKNGSTFSFCNTLGPATASQGYKKADVFDQNGNVQKGLGGGKCQVSSTLYNAVLKVQNLVVTERHQHSNKVPYVEKGKDAAVAYR